MTEWRAAVEGRMDSCAMSRRKREVAWLVLAGLDNHEISRLLNISDSTIKNHLNEMYYVLGLEAGPNLRAPRRAQFVLLLLGIDLVALRTTLNAEMKDTLSWNLSTPRSRR